MKNPDRRSQLSQGAEHPKSCHPDVVGAQHLHDKPGYHQHRHGHQGQHGMSHGMSHGVAHIGQPVGCMPLQSQPGKQREQAQRADGGPAQHLRDHGRRFAEQGRGLMPSQSEAAPAQHHGKPAGREELEAGMSRTCHHPARSAAAVGFGIGHTQLAQEKAQRAQIGETELQQIGAHETGEQQEPLRDEDRARGCAQQH